MEIITNINEITDLIGPLFYATGAGLSYILGMAIGYLISFIILYIYYYFFQ